MWLFFSAICEQGNKQVFDAEHNLLNQDGKYKKESIYIILKEKTADTFKRHLFILVNQTHKKKNDA